jgi:hypothetical protein
MVERLYRLAAPTAQGQEFDAEIRLQIRFRCDFILAVSNALSSFGTDVDRMHALKWLLHRKSRLFNTLKESTCIPKLLESALRGGLPYSQ